MLACCLLCLAHCLQLRDRAPSSGNVSELVVAHDKFIPMKKEQCEIARDYTAEASLCSVGSKRFTNLQAFLPGFAQMWAEMKTTFEGMPCCMGINHLFAVYHTVLTLKPKIICVDPVDSMTYQVQTQGIQGYHDPEALYLTG